MKTSNPMVLLALVTALTAWATPMPESLQTKLKDKRPPPQIRPESPNEWRHNGISYSGIAVQLFRAPQPLQLINPLAPESYGPGEQNVVRDPITHEVVGLKALSIDF